RSPHCAVDDELHLGRKFDRQIGGLRAFEDAPRASAWDQAYPLSWPALSIRTISERSLASVIRSIDERRASVVSGARTLRQFSENLTARSSSLSGRSGLPRLISTSSTIRLPSFVVTDRIAGACCGKMESQRRSQRQRSVDPGVGIVVGRIGLEAEIGSLPDRCQTICERVRIELSVDEAVVKAVAALECLRRPVHPALREQRALNRRLRGPSRLEPLDRSPRPVSLERAGGEAHCDADGISDRLRIEAEELRGRRRAGERATDRRRVLPPFKKAGAAAGGIVTGSIQP